MFLKLSKHGEPFRFLVELKLGVLKLTINSLTTTSTTTIAGKCQNENECGKTCNGCHNEYRFFRVKGPMVMTNDNLILNYFLSILT